MMSIVNCLLFNNNLVKKKKKEKDETERDIKTLNVGESEGEIGQGTSR